MPNFFSFNFMERFPVPSLRNYVGFSGVLLAAVLYYAYDTVANDESWLVEFNQRLTDKDLSETTRDWLETSNIARIFYFLLSDQICIWTVINSACCFLVLIGKVLQNAVFGRLRVIEHQQMRDRFWNFVFYKFVFVFGVMNVQHFDEVVLWSIWFALCGFFYLLTSLAQDRFKYVASFVNSSRLSNFRILMFLLVILFCTIGLYAVAAVVSVKCGWNYGGFLAAECFMLFFRALHGVTRYGVHLYDTNQHASWEDRTSFVYYSELIFEVLILLTDFIHHIHMLIWSNIFLSMASLVICMQLKHLYQEIDRRLRRHRNYQRIVTYIDSKYPMATVDDLSKNDDNCAICWDRMESARKLTCGHMFHNWCLRGWLEQDTSCPTCRTALSLSNNANNANNNNGDVVEGEQPGDAAQAQRRRRRHRTNHFFHFDGRRYARWLPSFSVEVSHNIGGSALLRRGFGASTSQLNRMAEQVREMFPLIAAALIEEDLQETNSVELTVDNILAGRLNAADGEGDASAVTSGSDEDETGSEFESEEGSSTESEHGEAVGEIEQPSTSYDVHPNPVQIAFNEYAASAAVYAQRHQSNETHSTGAIGSRFSKSTDERELILDDRKKQIIEENRQKYLKSPRAADLVEVLAQLSANQTSNVNQPQSEQKPSTSEHRELHARRRMLFNATQRRL